MTIPEQIQKLREALSNSLPGHSAYQLMMPTSRNIDLNKVAGKKVERNSGVLLLLYPVKNELYTVLIQRPDYNGPHGGQVSFPGGKWETTDATLIDTAIREAFEEVGVDSKTIEVIGSLTTFFIPVSLANVLPVVAFTPQRPNFVPNQVEVKEIIEVSLKELWSLQNRVVKTMHFGEVEIQAPGIVIDGHFIWGATAMMLSEFFQVWESL